MRMRRRSNQKTVDIESNRYDIKESLNHPEKEEPVKMRFSDYFLLILTGYGVILIPVVAFLAGISLLALWLFGAFR